MLRHLKPQPSRQYKNKNERFYFSPERRRLREQLRKGEVKASPVKEETKSKETEAVKEETVNKGPIHNCPLSKQDFRGPCAIMQCNFNVTSYNRSESCCLIIQNGGKDSFDKWDLQRSLGIAESKLYKLKEQGSKRASCILMLNKVLEFVRELPSIDLRSEKLDQISNFIGNSHLSLKELNVKASDVIQIKNNQAKIEEFIEQSGQSFTLADILGTTRPLP